jgi:hypothetical protein
VELAGQEERSCAVYGEQAAVGRDAARSGDGGLSFVSARDRASRLAYFLHLQGLDAQDRSEVSWGPSVRNRLIRLQPIGSRCLMILPLEAGIGAVPEYAAKAALEQNRPTSH